MMSGLRGHEKSRYTQTAVAMAKTEVDEKGLEAGSTILPFETDRFVIWLVKLNQKSASILGLIMDSYDF